MIKKYLTKAIALAIITTSMMALNPISANAEWIKRAKGLSNDWLYKNGNSWAKGWQNIDGNWYWFYTWGVMAHDQWIDGYYLDSNGAWTKTANYVTKDVEKDGITTGQSGQKYGRAGSEGCFPVVNGEPCLYTMGDYDYSRFIGLNTLNIYDEKYNIVDTAKLLQH